MNINAILIISCLISWGATEQEAEQEYLSIKNKIDRELDNDMLAYEKMSINEPMKLIKYE